MSTTWVLQSHYNDKNSLPPWTEHGANFLDTLTMKDMDMLMDINKSPDEASPLLSTTTANDSQHINMVMDVRSPLSYDMSPEDSPSLTVSSLSNMHSDTETLSRSHKRLYYHDSPMDNQEMTNLTPERDKAFSSLLPSVTSPERDSDLMVFSNFTQEEPKDSLYQNSQYKTDNSYQTLDQFHSGNGRDLSELEFTLDGDNKKCLVCGDEATGMYFGALVCVPCKTFFLRYAGDNFNFVCKHNKYCEITITTRTQCKYCRYQKCLKVGMCRRERPAKVELLDGQQLCVVCQDVANGVHFGAITCEGCKKFFRRGLKEHASYSCKMNEECEINPRTRNSCRFCRYKKCIQAGMSREAIQMGRPSKFKPSTATTPLHTPTSPGTEPRDYKFTQHPKAQSPWLSINNEDSASPMKIIKVEPMSPSSKDSYRFSPQMPHLASPGVMLQQFSPTGHSPDSSLSMLGSQRSYTLMDMNLSPGMVLPISSVNVDSTLTSSSAIFMNSAKNDALSPTTSFALPMSIVEMTDAVAQKRGSGKCFVNTSQACTTVNLPSPLTSHVPRAISSKPLSQTMTSLSTSQYTSSHPDALAGGVTSFHPSYVHDNKRYITKPPIYNAFVGDALEDKVKLTERSRSRKSRSRGTSSTTSSHVDKVEMNDFMNNDEMSTLGSTSLTLLGLTPSASMTSLSGIGGASGFPSEPTTPALSPGSPGHLEIPGMNVLDDIKIENKAETVDYILLNEISSFNNYDKQESLPSRRDYDQIAGFSSRNSTVPSDLQHSLTSTSSLRSGLMAFTSAQSAAVTGMELSPKHVASSPDTMYGQSFASLISHENNKSPGSSSSSSSSSASDQNGNVYEYIMVLSRHMDLVKQQDDSDSESSEKDNTSARDLLSRDTPNLEFKDFKEYWLKNDMPDENVMLTPENVDMIHQISQCYQQFVDTGTKMNKKLRRQLDTWMEMHAGQIKASPAWINEKVVPIYTLMSITYCRNLPGFSEFHKRDQRTIIKLGQSQSRILVAAKHWYKPELRDFQDFMSWRGAKTGTGDEFKQKLIHYAEVVQQQKMDAVEAAILNVLVLMAEDYPELQRPDIVAKKRGEIMQIFRAYTTAKYGTPNNRMETLFQLVPTLRELGLRHHRMTFHMRSARTTSSSSNT